MAINEMREKAEHKFVPPFPFVHISNSKQPGVAVKKSIDPKRFGLSAKTVIEELGKNHYALVVDRKSRVIMADGKKLVEKADKIKKVLPGIKVSLRSTAPVCSKTNRFLADHGIELING